LEKLGKPNTVDNPRDMFDMLNQRERTIFEAMRAQNPSTPRFMARAQAAREWNAEYFNPQNPIFQKMFAGRRAVGTGAPQQGMPRTRARTSGQFALLFSRYWKVKARDVGGTLIMLLQAPIIGVLLAAVFGGQKEGIPFWCLGALQELSKKSGGTAEGVGDTLRNMQPTPDHAAAILFCGDTTDVAADHPSVVAALEAHAAAARADLGDALTGAPGTGRRPVGEVDDPVTLTTFDPDHPYYIAEYDLPDRG
jgi:hypothetical protein